MTALPLKTTKSGYAHDARVPSFETGRTRVETMIAFKRRPSLVASHHVDDGIHAAKMMLPRTSFNATAAHPGLRH
jgi:hypothetical protein